MTQEINNSVYDLLVGEGKKFKDSEALAKGKLEADVYIESLKSQTNELRDELNKRLAVEEVLQKISAPVVENVPDHGSAERNKETLKSSAPVGEAPVSPTAILALVQKELELKERQRKAKENVEKVRNDLAKVWGSQSDISFKLEQKAKELGVSNDFLASIAETSPEAFLKLVKDTQETKAPTSNVPSSNAIDSSKFMAAKNLPEGLRNKAYYEDLKKRDKKMYFSSSIQAQMHKDAQTLGEKFYK